VEKEGGGRGGGEGGGGGRELCLRAYMCVCDNVRERCRESEMALEQATNTCTYIHMHFRLTFLTSFFFDYCITPLYY